MPLDTWEDLEAAIKQMIEDPTYRQWRPLIEQLQTLVGARSTASVNLGTAQGLLSVIEAVHSGTIQPGGIVEELGRAKSIFAQPNWQVETVIQVVVNTLPQLRTADPVILVPIVPVVMTASEAAELASGGAFAEQDALRKDFETLQADLKTYQLDGWTALYGTRPEDWRPFGEKATLRQRAEEALIALRNSQGVAKRLVPEFHDVRMLQHNRDLVLQLRREGCIVVLDTISLRHPALLAAFQRTMLDVYPDTSVLTIMPHHKVQDVSRNLIYSLQLSMRDSELAKRRTDIAEYGVCVEMTTLDDLPWGWLQSRVKKICRTAFTAGGIRANMNA